MLNIKIKGVNDNFVLPSKAYDDDFCFDCVATSRQYLSEDVIEYGLGFALEIDEDDRYYELLSKMFSLSIDIRPRSSIWKTGLMLHNSPGTADLSYRGEYKVIFKVIGEGVVYEVGDRVCQISVGISPKCSFSVVDELGKTERGECGFGSTGLKKKARKKKE